MAAWAAKKAWTVLTIYTLLWEGLTDTGPSLVLNGVLGLCLYFVALCFYDPDVFITLLAMAFGWAPQALGAYADRLLAASAQ